MKTKQVEAGVLIDEDQRVLVIDTPGDGAFGIWKAPQVFNGEVDLLTWQVYMETNGDAVNLPYERDCEEMEDIMADAEVTLDEFEAALGMTWDNWCT